MLSPLAHNIRMIHKNDYYDYIEKLKKLQDYYDVADIDGITPLFLSLQYSIINDKLLCLFKVICEFKHQNNTSFDDFNKNMSTVKNVYPFYYVELVNKIKRTITNEDIIKKLNI